ncbi:MAG: lysophospholipid acyltransferase family protein [Planctomycetales bacterium]
MSVDVAAGWTLIGYVLALAVVIAWRAWRCPEGWQLWLQHAICTAYCRICFHWRANGPCPFLEARPGIIIANHSSPADPLLIWVGISNCRPMEFMTAAEYCDIPVLRILTRAQRCIPVARDGKDMAATRTALRRLQENRLVGVFPEGKINDGSGLLPGNPGIAFLALHSRAPVYPVYIENAPRGKNMVQPFWNFRRVTVHYGEAVDLSEYYGRRRTPELLQEVTDLLMSRLAQLGDLEQSSPDSRASQERRDVLPLAQNPASA